MEIEKGQIITFENTTWFVEDVESLDDGKSMFTLKANDGTSEKSKQQLQKLTSNEWHRKQMQDNEASMQLLLTRLNHSMRQLDLIVEMLIEQLTKNVGLK